MNQLQALLKARSIAEQLFKITETEHFLVPGRLESELNQELFQIAQSKFEIQKFWHKRIVRIGKNTIHPYRVNPDMDLRLQNDDIVYIDFGPVIGDMEADFGRTYVLGNKAEHHQLLTCLKNIWNQGKAFYHSHPNITGQELFAHMGELAKASGYTLADWHSGHLIGQFPHERSIGDEAIHYICPENSLPMNSRTATGEKRTWILEVHLVSPDNRFGGFIEDLLLPEISV